ncbi:response regulator [Flavobacterium gilvum]|uniref:Response regulatory domain-containing protein n=1 Tax=Flavobacterium gilvum TaxID=1492737 RepID=A0AAC9N780_9FLAO|nr:response regulator [Flavobacterium gilvum]AOW10589.1 hypothetical protein EM308_14420 [Flavobacterium gilvum]KFC57593.1 hypothetical protein FEM08_36290 [Flavobacterium gilvum]
MENRLNCVLLVDDDFPTSFINKKIIQKADIAESIQVVLNGKEAIDYLCSQGKFESKGDKYPQPQLILLDINMPVMDGWEFMKTFKSLDIKNKEEIVIVMLSSSGNPDDKIKCALINEISDFKQKPLSREILLDIIANYF